MALLKAEDMYLIEKLHDSGLSGGHLMQKGLRFSVEICYFSRSSNSQDSNADLFSNICSF